MFSCCFGSKKIKTSATLVDECPVCLETTELFLLKNCKHAFCSDCIQQWFITSNDSNVFNPNVFNPTCPLCRKRVMWKKNRFKNYLSIEVY